MSTTMETPVRDLEKTLATEGLEMFLDPSDGFCCTRELGHEGIHVAHGFGFLVVHRWERDAEGNLTQKEMN